MKTQFSLHVIQPSVSQCSEKEENMIPVSDGNYCKKCSKTVLDITGFTKEEFADFAKANYTKDVCVKMRSEFQHTPVIWMEKIPQKKYAEFLFALSLFIVFGTLLFSFTQEEQQNVYNEAIKTLSEQSVQAANEEIIAPAENKMFVEDKKIEASENSILKIVTQEQLNKDTAEYILDPVIINSKTSTFISSGIFVAGSMVNIVTIKNMIIDTLEEPSIISPEVSRQLPLLAFPNPASESITIEYEIQENGIAILALFDLSGRKIADLMNDNDIQPGKSSQLMPVNDLPAGMYILILVNNNHQQTFKLQVVH